MPFSFNPGQPSPNAGTAPVQPQPQAQPQAPAPAAPGAVSPQATSATSNVKNNLPSVPDSPFLFISQRNQNKQISITAYLQIILMVVAILSVLASLVLFAYGMYLSSSIQSKKEELAAKEADFPTYPLDDMKRLALRFRELDTILKGYVSVRSPLMFLQDVVENQVVFNNYSFTKNLNGGGYTIAFSIITKNYRTLIQQLDALNLSQYSRIVPKPKILGLTDNTDTIKVNVSAPVFVEGKLPNDITFLPPTSSTTKSEVVASSTKNN